MIKEPILFERVYYEDYSVFKNDTQHADLCVEGVQEYFRVPNSAKKIWVSLHKRPAKHRHTLYRKQVSTDGLLPWAVWQFSSGSSPWGGQVDRFLSANVEGNVVHIQVEYE